MNDAEHSRERQRTFRDGDDASDAGPEAGADFELVEREVPQPGFGEALIRVHACGVCHSDMFAKEGGYPGVSHPLVPGHEIAGAIEQLGEGVHGWEVGQRVGVGWFGGNCGYCEWCRRGSLIDCENMEIPGITMDGGYADYVVVRASAMASMPEDLAAEEAGPLLCAGITTYNALRTSGARGGDRVAILGVGGLGHLGVQFASKLGFETVAIARGTAKEELARKLGAHHYVDSTAGDPAEALQKLGGVDLILSTVTNSDAMGAVFGGLRPQRQAARGRRLDGADPGTGGDAHRRLEDDHRSRLRHFDRLRGHAQLQRALRRASDDRDRSPRARRGGLREDDERRRAVPDGHHDRRLRAHP